jgi:hypothetical protein
MAAHQLRRAIIGCFVALVSSATLYGDTTFPYVAYIATQQSFARSGPGQQHYPTQQLPLGHAVEVYRHDSEGWCAVRPPEGSFCWIPAHEVHRLSPNKAEISVQTTVARVGSGVSPARNAVQVMLRRGEQVDLLPAGANDDPRWLRIAPPNGEFRWIAANSLSRTPPVEGSTGVQLATSWTRQRVDSAVQPAANESADAFSHLLNSVPSAQPPYPTTNTPPAALPAVPTNTDPNAVQIVAGSPASVEMSQGSALAPPALMGNPTPIPGADSNAAGNEPRTSTTPRIRFGHSPTITGPAPELVQEMQLRLSQIIVQPKEEWQLQQLQSEAISMLEKSDSVSEREHIRDLLERIALFQQVQSGAPSAAPVEIALKNGTSQNDPITGGQFTGMTGQVRDRIQEDLVLNNASSKDPFEGSAASPASTSPNEPRYDAVGRLKPVTSELDENAPRYALVDDRGGVVSFVTPGPDLNLQPYIGMRIGVNGSRGFMPEYRKAHVTAGRVTPIEDRIRR